MHGTIAKPKNEKRRRANGEVTPAATAPAATNQGRTQAGSFVSSTAAVPASGQETTETGRAHLTPPPNDEVPAPLSVFRQIVKAECKATANIDLAKSRVMAALAADPELREALRDHAEKTLVGETIYELRHYHNTDAKSAHKPCGYTMEAMRQTSESLAKSILDTWTLSIGKYLGDATGAELKIEAERERQQAHGHTLNARLFEQLAELAGDDGTVRDEVKNADELWSTIKGK